MIFQALATKEFQACQFENCPKYDYELSRRQNTYRKSMGGLKIFLGFKNKQTKIIYRISANSFRGNYSFLNLTLCTVTFVHITYRCGNYLREETIQGWKLFAEIR